MDKCPTCLQNVSEEYKNNISENANNEVNTINNILSGNFTKKSDLAEKIDAIRSLIDKFIEAKNEMDLLKIKFDNLKDKENRIIDTNKQIENLNNDIQMLNKQDKIIDEEIKNYEKYNLIFNEKSKELQNSKENENKATIKKAEINKETKFLEFQIEELKENLNKKEGLRNETN